MAISPKIAYPGKIDLSDPTGYPLGKARNITVPTDGTGTPLESKWVNDVFGFFQALLDDAGAAPSNTPEKVGASQYLDAIKGIAAAFGGSVGSISAWVAPILPSGHLECDGSAISRATFSDLFIIIGTRFGIGDGATTFNIPDFRGEFLRGFDNGAGNDPDAGSRTDAGGGATGDAIGTKQLDEFGSHTHDVTGSTVANVGDSRALFDGDDSSGTINKSNAALAEGGNETRPRNIYVMYIIKT